MLKILTVVGARPQFIKAAAINRAFRTHFAGQVKELIIHTGQHYDSNMSDVFFQELELDQPAYSLKIGSATHGKQTGEMLGALEEVMLAEQPHAVIVYGDTNSTLAGALAAAKLNIPVIHIEAGIRSYNRTMPEEVNRIMTDHVSTLLFTPTRTGYESLVQEGIAEANRPAIKPASPKVYHCGDIMYDNSLYFAQAAERKSDVMSRLGLDANNFILATIHRNNNTDDPARLTAILRGILLVSQAADLKVVLPLHPRTRKMLQQPENHELYVELTASDRVLITEPIGFLEMSLLEKHCALVMTDSGGVQKEAYFFKKPCLILRPETEWIEIVKQGSAICVDADTDRIVNGFNQLVNNRPTSFPEFYGDGQAADFIVKEIVAYFSQSSD